MADDPKLVSWAWRKLCQHGLAPNDPVTWYVEYQEGKREGRDPETVTRGMARDPFDALCEAEVIAYGFHGPDMLRAERGIGRWQMEVLGEEGTSPDHLVVRPVYDPEGGLPLTACLLGESA